MTRPLYPRPQDPDFSNAKGQDQFVSKTQTPLELLQKELSVIHARQKLLKERVLLMKEALNDTPSSQPAYTTLLSQIQMDQIEIDENQIREQNLLTKIEKLNE